MIELKVDFCVNGYVTFHIERQDEEDYVRLDDKPFTLKLSEGFYHLKSRGFIGFNTKIYTFFVRGNCKDKEYRRIVVSISNYLIIYKLVKKYNETCFDFWKMKGKFYDKVESR